MASDKLRVVAYARVSTSHHKQNTDVQLHDLRRYVEARGWTLSHEIADQGYSGGTDARPGLKRLLSLVRSRQVDVVLVTKLDRLFRSLRHLVTTLEEFQSLRVQFVSTGDPMDWTTPAGRLLGQILGSLAEFEKSLLRERTLTGLAYARAMGKTLGRPRHGKDDAILKLHKDGFSHRAIAKKLRVSKGSVHRAIESAPKTPASANGKNPVISGGDDE